MAHLTEAIEAAFTHHPASEHQVTRYEQIREHAKGLAHAIDELCPDDTREKLIALDRLRECVMWSNASIAVNEADES